MNRFSHKKNEIIIISNPKYYKDAVLGFEKNIDSDTAIWHSFDASHTIELLTCIEKFGSETTIGFTLRQHDKTVVAGDIVINDNVFWIEYKTICEKILRML